MMLHDLHYLTSQWYTLCQLWFTLIKYKNNELRTSLFCSKKNRFNLKYSQTSVAFRIWVPSVVLCSLVLLCWMFGKEIWDFYCMQIFFSYFCNRLSIFLCWNHCFRLLSIKYQVCFILLPLMYVICIRPES